jgi:hypothetical protein
MASTDDTLHPSGITGVEEMIMNAFKRIGSAHASAHQMICTYDYKPVQGQSDFELPHDRWNFLEEV